MVVLNTTKINTPQDQTPCTVYLLILPSSLYKSPDKTAIFEANVSTWIDLSSNEKDKKEMTALIIDDKQSWRSWWRVEKRKTKMSAKQILADKWNFEHPPSSYMPSSWLAFVIWGRFSEERWGCKI